MILMDVDAVEATIRENVANALGFDFRVTQVQENCVELCVPFSERMIRLGGTISGPILMTAVDTAMYGVVISHVVNGQYGVTSHLNFEFVRRPPQADLTVTGRLLRAGRRQAVCSVEITSTQDQRLVLQATGAYALFQA